MSFLSIEALQYLSQTAQMSIGDGVADESVGYALLNEMFIEHKNLRPRGDFLIFPQLRLRWNPDERGDRRGNLPDLGFGRLVPPNGRIHLLGGAEHKAPIVPLMLGLPDPLTLYASPAVRNAFAMASLQASDQVKAAIKNGAVSQKFQRLNRVYKKSTVSPE